MERVLFHKFGSFLQNMMMVSKANDQYFDIFTLYLNPSFRRFNLL